MSARKQAASLQSFLIVKVGNIVYIFTRKRKKWEKADSIWFVQPEKRKRGRLKDKKVENDLFSLGIHALTSDSKNR